jgi:hypothetical protein
MQHAKEFRLHDRETVKGLIVKRSVCVVGVRRKNAITERATTCSTAYKAPTGRRTTAAESPRRHLQGAPLMIWKHQLGNTVAVLLPEPQPQAYSCSKPPALPPAIER